MVSTLSMIFMGISAAISIGLPAGLFIALRKKHELKVIPMLVGAAAFIVFALILEQLLHILVLRPDETGAIQLKNNPALYVLYGIFAAGIFEETGRFLSFTLLKKKYNGIGTGLSYGIGHGGIEAVLIVGVTMVNNLIISTMINSGAAESLGNSPQVLAQLTALKDTSPILFLVGGLERISAIVIHISLSLIVWYAVNKKGKWWLFPAAIGLHALIDVPAALTQVGVINNILLVELLVVLCAVGLAVLAVYLCKTFKQNDIGRLQD